jgi:hypothetical protein
VEDVVFIVSVELPGEATGSGENTAVVPAGRPATVSETLPTEPPTTDTATVYLAVCLRKIVTDDGLTDGVKSRGETTSVTAVVCEMPPAVPVIVSAARAPSRPCSDPPPGTARRAEAARGWWAFGQDEQRSD